MTDSYEVPIVDVGKWRRRENLESQFTEYELTAECEKIAESLRSYGAVMVLDSAVDEKLNDAFIDMMEKYYEQSDGKVESRPELSFQVGVTPSFTERPRNHCEKISSMKKEMRPLVLCPPEADPKWRYFWRIGNRPEHTDFAELNSEPVFPDRARFPDWTQKMNDWGYSMLNTLEAASEMLAVGLKLPQDSFRSRMENGPHLLAPTGVDLNAFGVEGTVLAGYHYDLNFLTIHGKSRFPALTIWLRSGRKCNLTVPDGCFFIQAGKQLEHLTGGYIEAGYHEVAVNSRTVDVIEARRVRGESLWRILEPLEWMASLKNACNYKKLKAGEQVRAELEAIALGAKPM